MGPVQSLADFIDMVRRRAGLILVLTVLGCAAALLLALSQRHLYRAIEVIQVVQPKVAGELARSTVEGSAARRLQSVEQRLMARDSVLEIVEQYGLYSDFPAMTPTQKVAALREAVQIEDRAAAGNGREGAVSVITVTAAMPTPRLAQQLAHEFAQRTIALSREARLEQARETLAFFTAREDALRDQVGRLEDEMTAFRKANDLALPGTLEFRRDEVAGINQELLTIARERIRIERAAETARRTERPATAERMLEEYDEELATLDAQARLLQERKDELESSIQTTPQIERRLGAFERELEQVRAELDAAAARRTAAEVGYRLETQGQGEQLTVIEPATMPDYPFTRSRTKMALAGGVASVLMALAVAFLLDLLNPVMRTPAHMERDLGIKPVAAVPRLETRPRRRGLRERLFGRRPARRRDGDSSAV